VPPGVRNGPTEMCAAVSENEEAQLCTTLTSTGKRSWGRRVVLNRGSNPYPLPPEPQPPRHFRQLTCFRAATPREYSSLTRSSNTDLVYARHWLHDYVAETTLPFAPVAALLAYRGLAAYDGCRGVPVGCGRHSRGTSPCCQKAGDLSSTEGPTGN
jgi:hypothetical protein